MHAAFLKRVPTSAVLFLFFLSIYVFGMSGWIQYGDEIEKYRVAQSIVERHEFSFRPTEMRNEVGVNGRTYSIYEMGQTLWEVPFYVLGKVAHAWYPQPDANTITLLFVGLLDPLVTALTCVFLFKTCTSLGFRLDTALALTLVFGLGTIAWPYSKGFTREPILTLLVLLSFYTAFLYKETGQNRWILAGGLVAGYLTYTKFIQAMVIPFLAIYLAIIALERGRRVGLDRRQNWLQAVKMLGIFFSPFIFFLGLQSIYAVQRFGSLYAGIAGTKRNPLDWVLLLVTSSKPLEAFFGLLFSQEKGIFVYSPPALLAFIGLPIWLRTRTKEAWLFIALILVEFASVILRPDWSGGSWWGPRYLVQITPLLIIPLGAWLESEGRISRTLGAVALAVAFLAGLFVQIVGVMSSDRDYLDTTGQGTFLAGQVDFLRHSAFESLLVHLPTAEGTLQINPLGFLLLATAGLLGLFLFWKRRMEGDPVRSWPAAGWALMSLVLVIQSAAFLAWVVAPYSAVLAAKADDKYLAGNAFLADGRICEAGAMYLMAMERGTRFQNETRVRLLELLPHAQGKAIPTDDLLDKVESSSDATVGKDERVSLKGVPSLRIHSTSGEDVKATATSQPVQVLPNTTYEFFGWMRTEKIYGTGYAAISLFEDDGNWKEGRDTDVRLMDETRGWQPFRKIVTTLPTTKRMFVKSSLWNSFGTVWFDGIELSQVSGPVPVAWGGGRAMCPVQRFK